MPVTIDLQVDHQGRATACPWPMAWEVACQILGIGVGAKNPRPTRAAYRKWLGLRPGHRLDKACFNRLHCMVQFVGQGGGGTYFSRRNFVRLEEAGQLEAELARLGIEPHPLTVDDH